MCGWDVTPYSLTRFIVAGLAV